MGKIKGWTKRNDLWKGSNWLSYSFENDTKKFINIGNSIYSGQKNMWFVSGNNGKRWFKTKAEAVSYAIRYMKSHPKG